MSRVHASAVGAQEALILHEINAFIPNGERIRVIAQGTVNAESLIQFGQTLFCCVKFSAKPSILQEQIHFFTVNIIAPILY